jgi:endonuclease/exonuclease/phosphatase family metal-dependent hydrolase
VFRSCDARASENDDLSGRHCWRQLHWRHAGKLPAAETTAASLMNWIGLHQIRGAPMHRNLTTLGLLLVTVYSGTLIADQPVLSPTNTSTVSDHVQTHRATLKVITLNIAHGRHTSFNQMFLRKERIQANLTRIADVLKREKADVVALQEADDASRWSGGFDHVSFLAAQANFPFHAHAVHAKSRLYNYGTALLSKWPIDKVIEHDFQPSPPTTNKGFTLVALRIPPTQPGEHTRNIDMISVHLDFSRKKIRQQQIAEMITVLGQRNNPRIILGDFNSDWLAKNSAVRALAENSQLQVYEPETNDLGTYGKNRGKRLDWVLISDDFEFVDYRVIDDILSDHFAVLAEVRLKTID